MSKPRYFIRTRYMASIHEALDHIEEHHGPIIRSAFHESMDGLDVGGAAEFEKSEPEEDNLD